MAAALCGMCVRPSVGLARLASSFSARFRLFSTEINKKAAEHVEGKQQKGPEKVDASPELSETERLLMEEKKKLSQELQQFKDKYIMSLAETENVRMRVKKQIEEAKLFSIQGFCKDLLEVADVLAAATESVPKQELEVNHHLKTLYEGLTLTESQLKKVFNKHGVSHISPAIGDKFDPYLHEAMFEVPLMDNKAGTVAVLTKIGYKLHMRTIRPAVVGVFKN